MKMTKVNKIPPYNPDLKMKARSNRKNMNLPEAELWYKVLNKRRMLNYRFIRQRPINKYIVDFYCAKLKLIIEVDGESHNDQIEYDKKRERYQQNKGLKVIHYTNIEIMCNLEGVYLDIEKRIKERKKEINPL